MDELIGPHDPLPDCDCRACAIVQRDRLRIALNSVLNSDIGRQTLLKLADGQGIDTAEGQAWLNAKSIIDECNPTYQEAIHDEQAKA